MTFIARASRALAHRRQKEAEETRRYEAQQLHERRNFLAEWLNVLDIPDFTLDTPEYREGDIIFRVDDNRVGYSYRFLLGTPCWCCGEFRAIGGHLGSPNHNDKAGIMADFGQRIEEYAATVAAEVEQKRADPEGFVCPCKREY